MGWHYSCILLKSFKEFNFRPKLDSQTCSLKLALHLEIKDIKGLPWCLPPSLPPKACWNNLKIKIRLHVATLTCIRFKPCNFIETYSMQSLGESSPPKMAVTTFSTFFVSQLTKLWVSESLVFKKKNRINWSIMMNQPDASIPRISTQLSHFGLQISPKPSGSRRRFRRGDRCSSGPPTRRRADLPWCFRRRPRIHRCFHGWGREVRSGETCIQHLKSKT